MPITSSTSPTRFAMFALEQATALPISNMPVYAELIAHLQVEEPAVQVDNSLNDLITESLRALEDPQLEQRLLAAIRQEIARLLGPSAGALLRANGNPVDFFTRMLERVRKGARGAALRRLDAAGMQTVIQNAIRAEAENEGISLHPPATTKINVWSFPLGVLATDHTGYLSYDLTRLPANVQARLAAAIDARRLDPAAVLDVNLSVYPMAGDVFDALSQNRFSQDAIVARVAMARPSIPDEVANMALPAMQDPSLADWRLSPGSFATNPGSLVGADGCESILPANIALQEYYFYQVFRLTDIAPPVAPRMPGQVQLGMVNEYRVSWNPLGHSLGQIIYSLPLAPGESVNLTVIDWTRRDEAQRKERTTVDEQLVHNEHRDRTISEAVNTAVNEYQHGSNFTGGISGGLGGTSSSGSAGIAGSLGGSTSSTSGTRDVAGTTVQKLSDNITQASSSLRELQSTVVVQSTQSEKEAIETRTIVNYNHSHALTILYYEVLRHFRVVTELTRQRPAVLVKFKTDWFDNVNGNAQNAARENILSNRAVLAGALLDSRFAGGFDALERVSHGPFADFNIPLPVAALLPPGPHPTPPPFFHYFTFEIRAGNFIRDVLDDDQRADIKSDLLLIDGRAIPLTNNQGNPVINYDGSFRIEGQNNVFTAIPKDNGRVAWADIRGIRLAVAVHKTNDSKAKVSFSHIKVSGIDEFGPPGVVLVDEAHDDGHIIIRNANFESGRQLTLPTRRPPLPAAPAPLFSPADASDRAQSLALIAHLNARKSFYSRSIALGLNTYERINELDAVHLADNSTALQHLENRPLEVVGDYLAYPGTDAAWNHLILSKTQPPNDVASVPDAAPDERLVTLPTRGVFAEAKLGHCNASERIDNTRFWDWQQSPIPHFAPEIAPAVPVTPQPQQTNLSPTPFPSSIVNIVNPPNAPDPTGLAAAFKVLGTPNLFRDLSGAQGVAQLLQTLANDAVAFAKGGTGMGAGGTKLPGGATTPGTGAGATPSFSPAIGATTALSNTPANVGEVNQLAAGIRSQLPPSQADPLVGQLYQDAIDKAGADNVAGASSPDADLIQASFGLSNTGSLAAHVKAWGLANANTNPNLITWRAGEEHYGSDLAQAFPDIAAAAKFQYHSRVISKPGLTLADVTKQLQRFEDLFDTAGGPVQCSKAIGARGILAQFDAFKFHCQQPLTFPMPPIPVRAFTVRVIDIATSPTTFEFTVQTLFDHPYAGRRSWRVTDGGGGVFSIETAEINTFPWIPDYWGESATHGEDARATWERFLGKLTVLLGSGVTIKDDSDIKGHTVFGTQADIVSDTVAKSVLGRFASLADEFARIPISV